MQINKIISALPLLKSTTIIIAQHMARGFIPSFIKRLEEKSINSILKAEDGETVQSGCIYVCMGYTQMIKSRDKYRFIQEDSVGDTYNPDINFMFKSIVPFVDDFNVLGVILTGIGEDGVAGCKALNDGKVKCLTETSDSAIVDGMPSRAREIVPTIETLNMDDIIIKVREFCR